MSSFPRFKFQDSRFTIKGMTLIELLVVVGIMAVLTGVAVGYSKQSRNQILLNVEKAKIAQTISRAKSLTLAGYTKPVSLPPPCAYGFGIDYTKGEYFIFQYNLVGCSGIASLASLDTDQNQPDPPFKLFENFTLPSGVNFGQSVNKLGYLLFIPPNLTTLLFEDENTPALFQDLTIYLETPDQSLQREIIVKTNGQLTL
ncbi:MAG: prepilin-type N-terminal cleavage/methylation domain-containing protein [Patescibacteria group bacterium]